jgi:hypothetical protein
MKARTALSLGTLRCATWCQVQGPGPRRGLQLEVAQVGHDQRVALVLLAAAPQPQLHPPRCHLQGWDEPYGIAASRTAITAAAVGLATLQTCCDRKVIACGTMRKQTHVHMNCTSRVLVHQHAHVPPPRLFCCFLQLTSSRRLAPGSMHCPVSSSASSWKRACSAAPPPRGTASSPSFRLSRSACCGERMHRVCPDIPTSLRCVHACSCPCLVQVSSRPHACDYKRACMQNVGHAQCCSDPAPHCKAHIAALLCHFGASALPVWATWLAREGVLQNLRRTSASTASTSQDSGTSMLSVSTWRPGSDAKDAAGGRGGPLPPSAEASMHKMSEPCRLSLCGG